MEKIICTQYDNQSLRCVNSFARLTDTSIPVSTHLNNCLKLWNFSWLNNDMRNFLFKFRNNDLRLNNRVNAYDNTVDPRCTFCRIIDAATVVRDSLNHAFYDCPTVKHLLVRLIDRCEPRQDVHSRLFRQLYWYGSGVTAEDDESFAPNGNLAGLIIFDTFRYVTWKFRLKRRVPNINSFSREFDFVLKVALSNSRKATEILAGDNMFSNFLQARG